MDEECRGLMRQCCTVRWFSSAKTSALKWSRSSESDNVTTTTTMKMMGMMRYLVETDYLFGSWMRTEEEPFAGVTSGTRALAHLRGKFPRCSWTGWCGSTLSSYIYANIPGTHLGLDMLTYSPKSSNASYKNRTNIDIFFSLGNRLNHILNASIPWIVLILKYIQVTCNAFLNLHVHI